MGYYDQIVETSKKTGEDIDLSSIRYNVDVGLPQYYRFLAGFCATNKISKVLEIGTLLGGSASAMHSGILAAGLDPCIVTVDIHKNPAKQLDRLHGVHRMIGRPLAFDNLKSISEIFNRSKIDLAFLDSTKDGPTVLAQFGVLTSLFEPRFVIMDDITLNDTMTGMWAVLVEKYDERACNIGLEYPQVRITGELNPGKDVVRHPGFGIVQLR